jgi:hypothetical protein
MVSAISLRRRLSGMSRERLELTDAVREFDASIANRRDVFFEP